MYDTKGQLKEQDALRFILGGKSLVTIESTVTNKRYTYKVQKAPKRYKDGRLFFVKLLVGSNNEDDYKYIGMYNKSTGYFGATKNANHLLNHTGFKAFKWTIEHLFAKKPTKVNIYHSGKCSCCGRTLTTPESIQTGIGPKCLRRFQN